MLTILCCCSHGSLKFVVHKDFLLNIYNACYAVASTNSQYSLAKLQDIYTLVAVQKSNSRVKLSAGQENGICTCMPKLMPLPTLASISLPS